MNFKEAFSLLQLSPGASLRLINQNFRALIKKSHPDHNQTIDTTELTQLILSAKDLLLLLITPYEILEESQRVRLLEALNNTPQPFLTSCFEAYPTKSWAFYRDCLHYPELRPYFFLTKNNGCSQVLSLFSSCFCLFTSQPMKEDRAHPPEDPLDEMKIY